VRSRRRRGAWGRALGAALLVAAFPAAAAPPGARDAELLAVVKAFYGWVLEHGREVEPLAPRIVDDPGSTRYHLDRSRLPKFTAGFMKSGLFAAGFPRAVERYYARQDARIRARPRADLDQEASDGRGPVMEVEDMDLFFCAQEHEYTAAFVAGFEPRAVRRLRGRTQVDVESPAGWPGRFWLVREGSRWRIAGYCVFA
jgi:hypothetical protein